MRLARLVTHLFIALVIAGVSACDSRKGSSITPAPPDTVVAPKTKTVAVHITGGLGDTVYALGIRATGDIVSLRPDGTIRRVRATLDPNLSGATTIQDGPPFFYLRVDARDSTHWTWALLWTATVPEGRHTLRVIADDALGSADTTTASFFVTVPVVSYTATLLSANAGDTINVFDLNNRGDIAGSLTANRRSRAAIWHGGGAPVVLSPLDTTSYEAHAINDAGIVVGSMFRSDSACTDAVVWSATGIPTAIRGVCSSHAIDVNARGDILVTANVFTSSLNLGNAFVLTAGRRVPFTWSDPASLNDRLEVVGMDCFHDIAFECFPKYLKLSAVAPVAIAAAAPQALAAARLAVIDTYKKINNRGHIVRNHHESTGVIDRQSLIRPDMGDTLDIPGLVPGTTLIDVNDDDVIVISGGGNPPGVWIWNATRISRVVLTNPGLQLVGAVAINNTRQILASVGVVGGTTTYAVLTPVP